MTAAQQDALRGLADIVGAAPVSMRPQTWAWAVLTGIVVALVALLAWRWALHRAANRYRREALGILAPLRTDLSDPEKRAAALVQAAVLLKRTALVAYSRPDVARLSGQAWVDFLSKHARAVPAPMVMLLNDLEYRPAASLVSISEHDARAAMDAAAHWIRTHHVSA